jgi:AAA domain-containing protein/carboxypeptidase family protein
MTSEPLYASCETDFYTIRGALPTSSRSYIEREADNELYDNLIQANFCYVLTARQVGKSSLMLKTVERLNQAGVAVAVLDLTGIGQNVTPEQWYFGLLDQMGLRLHLEDELENYWIAKDKLGPLDKWKGSIRDVVLTRYPNKVVIFIDEIDAVRSLPFNTGEFFAGIREFFNRRQVDQELGRLTFCLLGAARPSDLVEDPRMAPFNIAKRIDLTDFTEREAQPLARGLCQNAASADELIKRVLYWTGGHPYLTQYLCHALANESGVTEVRGVDQVCEKLFLSSVAREENENFQYVSKRLLDENADTIGLLNLYSQVHRHRCADDEPSAVSRLLHKDMSVESDMSALQEFLEIVGVIRLAQRCLRVRNRVYHRVFDRKWVVEKMPRTEANRQLAAFKRRVMRWTIYAGVICLVILSAGVYAFVQHKRADAALNETKTQRQVAELVSQQLKVTQDEAMKKGAELEGQRRDAAEEAQRTADYLEWQTKVMTWQVIMNDTNPLIFQAYLEVYGDTEFARLAKRRQLDLLDPKRPPQDAAKLNGVVRGKVSGTAATEPIAGAKLIARKQGQGADWSLTMFSSKSGEFMLAPMPQGSYTIVVSATGYNERSMTVEIGPDGVSKIKQQPVRLAKKESNPT